MNAKRTLRVALTTSAILITVVAVAQAHDLFLKPVTYFVAPNSDVLVRVLNGTFSRSENAVARPRLRDISVVTSSGRERVDTTAWTAMGDTSAFHIRTKAAGTYVIGVSTKPNVIGLKATEFNTYLRTDGVPDVLASRRRDKELDRGARERYSKHVKALIQVGDAHTDQFGAELGYPAELVPLDNPYALGIGKVLRVRTVVEGRPVSNQFVLYGGRTAAGERLGQRSVRSDSTGTARIVLRARGTWYVKFIHMTRMQSDTVDYESKWATLTFQVR